MTFNTDLSRVPSTTNCYLDFGGKLPQLTLKFKFAHTFTN